MPIRLALFLSFVAAPVAAADLGGYGGYSGYGLHGAPPRPLAPPLIRGCPPPAWVTRTPTNAPDDPTYVGSSFGLGRPSYYGNTPPPGIDDPYGRRCP